MKTEKWFNGLTASEILTEMESRYEAVVFDDYTDSFETFERMFIEVIHEIVDVKTEFFAYRKHNDVYSTWSKLESDLVELRVKAHDLFGCD